MASHRISCLGHSWSLFCHQSSRQTADRFLQSLCRGNLNDHLLIWELPNPSQRPIRTWAGSPQLRILLWVQVRWQGFSIIHKPQKQWQKWRSRSHGMQASRSHLWNLLTIQPSVSKVFEWEGRGVENLWKNKNCLLTCDGSISLVQSFQEEEKWENFRPWGVFRRPGRLFHRKRIWESGCSPGKDGF